MRPPGAYRKDVTAKRRARGFTQRESALGLFLHVFKDVFKGERAPTPVPLTCRPFSLPAGRHVLSPSASPVSRTLNFSASHRCWGPLCTDAKQVRQRPRPRPPCPPRGCPADPRCQTAGDTRHRDRRAGESTFTTEGNGSVGRFLSSLPRRVY